MIDIKDNKIELLEEEIECAHLYLDENYVPRSTKDGKIYSLVGRIAQFELKILKNK